MGASTPQVMISLVDSGGAFDPFRFLLIAVAGLMTRTRAGKCRMSAEIAPANGHGGPVGSIFVGSMTHTGR